MYLSPAPAPTEAPSLEIRQDFHILTQTIIRPSTTFITTITLGTVEPVTTETIAVVPVPISHHHDLSSGQVGAILGSVVGVVVLLLIVGFCYVGQRRMPITYEEETKEKRKTKRKGSSSSRTTRGVYKYSEEAVYYVPPKRKSSSRRASVTVEVQEPEAAIIAERIPGGPKFPTYRAIPISNPRNPQVWRSG
ncbi:hypothetical protein V8C35DRAFT_283663 [Trichoderma chlorosporum]